MLGNMFKSTNLDDVAQKYFKNYEVESTISWLSSLLTYPQYQENQYRIEQLILYGLMYCDGKKKFSYNCLEKTINNKKIFHIHMEGPHEDVFISNINSRHGSFRVFTGLHTSIDYFLQEIIELCETHPSKYGHVAKEMYYLLLLSEKLADKFNLERWCYGKSSAQKKIHIPKKNKLEIRRRSLYIKDSDLNKFKINLSFFENFISPLNKLKDTGRLHRYPFFKTAQGKMMLLIPSAICYSLCLYFVENVNKQNRLRELHVDISKARTRKILQGELIRKFNAYYPRICLLPSPNLNVIMIDDFVLEFDTNKFCHVIILNEDLSKFNVNNFNTPYSFNEQQENFINQRIRSISSYLYNSFGLGGGLTLIIPCGYTQGLYLELDKPLENNWYICSLSIAEFQFFPKDGSNQLLKIWKYLRSKENLLRNGINLINPDKFTNEYAYWVQNGYLLAPSDCEYPASQTSMITLSADVSAVYCIEKRKIQDAHSVRAFKDGAYSKVVRLMQNNIYEKNKNLDIYVAEDALELDILLGLVKIDGARIWLAINGESFSNELKDLSYHLWESILNKLFQSSYIFCGELKARNFDQISIQLFFEHPEEWASTRNINNSNLFDTKVDKINKKIIIVLKRQLLLELGKPVNTGEKLLLQECLKALFFLIGKDLGKTDIENILSKIFPSEYARHIHFIRVKELSFEIAYKSLSKNRKFLIQQEDLSEINLGLARKIGISRIPQIIDNSQDCKTIFDKIWLFLFKELQKNIRQYNSFSLVFNLLKNIEILSLESRRLKNTSKSIVIDYGEDGLLASSKEESLRAITSISCRILIEMSLCPITQDCKEASQSDIDHLMALASEMYSYANSSDSIHYNLNDSCQVRIHNNGLISMDLNELISVTNEYLTGYFLDTFEISEKEYNELYSDHINYLEQGDLFEFEEAFYNEYQIQLSDFTKIFQALIYFSERKKLAVVEISVGSLLDKLKDTVNLQVVKSFVSRFCFTPRTVWESTNQDSNFPWRFQRKLSLSFQPVILIENKLDFKQSKLIYGIQFIENSFRNIFSGIEQGWIDSSIFDSKRMKSLLGAKAEQLGNEFEKLVHNICLDNQWNSKHSVKMEFFGAPSKLGDVDVLVWSNHSNKIYALECKRLKMCRTARDIGRLLSKFRGDPSNNDDKLTKHINRVDWLNKNIDTVCSKLGITQQIIEIKALVVTNRLVPMGFINNAHLSKVEFITLNDISSLVCK
ncbi:MULTISPECIES: hypothetical protein [Legionella]|uniref:hypothetical protein n=1 Tax=Legionella TaxID=445 RepID=UPI00095E3899|nr:MULTISPECIES: hypothetical protein [Legionella]MBN9226517.1 hypothetical protein [Legionella steelei]OJW15560.1 MAG: hypothetical protein BGO44_12020 [Legionella sp. 39-23]